MTKNEKILVFILGIIALTIIGYNSFINAKNKDVDVKVTIDRSASTEIAEDTNDAEGSDDYVDDYSEYERLIEIGNHRNNVNIYEDDMEVYSSEEEDALLEQRLNEGVYQDDIDSSDNTELSNEN